MQPCINPCSCHYSERLVTAQKKRNKPGNGLKLCWEEMYLVINVEQTMSTRSCVMEKSLWSKYHILLGLYHDPPIILLIRERQHYFMVILMSSHFCCVWWVDNLPWQCSTVMDGFLIYASISGLFVSNKNYD